MRLADKIATMARRGAPLPYDAEVEYLETDGLAFINTGIFDLDNNTRVDIAIKYGWNGESTGNFAGGFGSYTQQGKRFHLWSHRNVSTGKLFFHVGINTNYSDYKEIEYTNYHDVIIDGSGFFVFDGVRNSLGGGSFSIQQEIDLFRYWDSTYGYIIQPGCGIKRCSILKNGTIVFDVKPVRFTNSLGISEGAMYDRVSGQLFRNAGTGAFIVGPDVVSTRGGGY